jgi:hypothetical protein
MPLHRAVETQRVWVVRVLLEHGASVDAEDGKGKTPFQVVSDPDIINCCQNMVPSKGMML